MRTAYHQQLDALAEQVGEMCGLAGLAMERATQALLRADLVLAEQIITDYNTFAERGRTVENDAFKLLALQAPVAGELRAVVASVQNVADLDRMGALAMHVAKLARRRHPAPVLPHEVHGHLAEMGRIAVDIGDSVKRVVLSADPDRAAELANDDDDMDHLHRQLFSLVLDSGWRHGAATAVDVTLLSRYYERFADHAVEIGRRVIFQATGRPSR